MTNTMIHFYFSNNSFFVGLFTYFSSLTIHSFTVTQPMLLVPAFDWYYYARLTGYYLPDDWLTLLTAVLADKPLGRQRPLTTGPKDVTGL